MSGDSCPTGASPGLTQQMGTWGDQGSPGPLPALATMGKGWSGPAVCTDILSVKDVHDFSIFPRGMEKGPLSVSPCCFPEYGNPGAMALLVETVCLKG